jgi:hypothetical protein
MRRSARTLSACRRGFAVDEMPKSDSRRSLAAWPNGSSRDHQLSINVYFCLVQFWPLSVCARDSCKFPDSNVKCYD